MNLLIKNATIINDDGRFKADILCGYGKISRISRNLVKPDGHCKIIDATGKYILPGGIDPHVHMHLPSNSGYSSDDFLSGSIAALSGGTTSLIDFVTPKRGQKLGDALEERLLEASNCKSNITFHVSPVEWNPTLKSEIKYCIKKGYRSFKTYMAYKDSIGLNDTDLQNVMEDIAEAGGIIAVHCEMGDEIEGLRNRLISEQKTSVEFHALSRPNKLESIAVKKAIEFAKNAACPIYIVHVSAKESLKYISEAKSKGQEVYAETCPQYLLLDNSRYQGTFNEASKYVMSPPLRDKSDNEALWSALMDGTIDTIGTDHCPFSQEQKNNGIKDFRKIPNGAGGVEHRLSLLYTFGVLPGKITLNRFVALTSSNAARIFGLFPHKGIIKQDSDADIIIWDPDMENTISAKTYQSLCDINIYEGFRTKGFAERIILGGNEIKI